MSWGGLEMNQLKNCHWMKARGHDVVMLCQKNSPIALHALALEIEVHYITEHRRYKYLAASFKLKRLLDKIKLSHLIVRSSNDLNICSIAKRFSKQKFKLHYFMEMQLGVKKKSFLHTARYSQLDHWICPLSYLKEQVLQNTLFPANKILIIPSGIELPTTDSSPSKAIARHTLKLPEKAFILGLIGRIDPLKGQHVLLEALTQVKNKDTVVCFIGQSTLNESTRYQNDLLELKKQATYKNRVYLLPFIEESQLFYQAIDVCIMASKSETFGMVTIEALSHGIPVIGSRAGGTPELILDGETGYLFESNNANDLAEKINQLQERIAEFDPQLIKASAAKYDHQLICSRVETEVLRLLK